MSDIIINVLPENSKPYPIYFKTASIYHVQESVRRPHGINFFHQILIVLDGHGIVRSWDQTYKLKRGSAFFTGLGVPVEYINEGGLVSAFLTADGSAARELADNYACGGFLYYESVNVEKYLYQIEKIINEYENTNNQSRLSSLAYSFYLDFFTKQESDSNDWLDKTVLYAEKNFTKKLTLEELANYGGVSASKLCRDFKARYKRTLFEYIVDLRLSYARSFMLSNPSARVKDAAEACGFDDNSYFCKAYKAKFGKSPTEDKKNSFM